MGHCSGVGYWRSCDYSGLNFSISGHGGNGFGEVHREKITTSPLVDFHWGYEGENSGEKGYPRQRRSLDIVFVVHGGLGGTVAHKVGFHELVDVAVKDGLGVGSGIACAEVFDEFIGMQHVVAYL